MPEITNDGVHENKAVFDKNGRRRIACGTHEWVERAVAPAVHSIV